MARHIALPTLALVVALAGCVSAPTVGGGISAGTGAAAGGAPGATTSGAGLGSDLAVSAGVGGAAGAAVGANNQAGISITAPGGNGIATSTNGSAVIANNTGSAVALDPKTPGYVSAKSGGVVTGPGGIQAVIPPGALTRDAIVKVSPQATDNLALTKNYVPGIVFNVDLGGAALLPGTKLTVSSKVDARFVAEMQKRDSAFTPEAYGLKQDASGTWLMSMPVNGPHVGAVAPDLGLLATPNGRALIETGNLALPAATPKRNLLDSSSTDCATWVETIKVPVPTTMSEWRTLENNNTFSCAVYDGTDWFMNIFYDLRAKKSPCGGATPVPGASPTPVAPVQAVPVPAHVTYLSDDPALDGKDAAGALVHFDLPWTPSNGPSEVQADAAGKANSSTLSGMEVSLSAFQREPDARGEAVRAEVSPGMAAVELKLPKYSPKITFEIDSELALGASTKVSYTLGAEAGTLDLATTAGSKTSSVAAFVRVPDDNFHAFTVTGIQSVAGSGVKPPLPEALQIRRNGTYTVKLSLILVEAR